MEMLLIGLLVGHILGRVTAWRNPDANVEAFRTRMIAGQRLAERNRLALERLTDGLRRGVVTAGQVQGLSNALQDTTDILTDIIDDHGQLLRQVTGGGHGG